MPMFLGASGSDEMSMAFVVKESKNRSSVHSESGRNQTESSWCFFKT